MLAVARAEDGARVGRLDAVGIAVADDHLGPHDVDDVVEEAGADNPTWNVQPSRRTNAVCLQVQESDLPGVAVAVDGAIAIEHVVARADERAGAVTPRHPLVEQTAIRDA